MAEDMEVANRADIPVTLATANILEVTSSQSLEGLREALSRGATLPIRILAFLRISLFRIAPNSARSSRRRFLPKNLRTSLSTDLISTKLTRQSVLTLHSTTLERLASEN